MDDHTFQLELLTILRQRLAYNLARLARLGDAAEYAIVTDIAEAREAIATTKTALRNAGLAVANHPDDEATAVDLYLPLDAVPAPAPLPIKSRMPLYHNPQFVGREAELLQIATALRASASVPLVVLSGLGGLGKTQLAAEFVHRYGRFFAGGICWLNGEDQQQLDAEVLACGGPEALDLPGFAALPPAEQRARVLRAWREPTPRLLVFDACEDPALLRRWRPTTGGCRILLTSRNAAWDAVPATHLLALAVLPRPASLALLGHFLPGLASAQPDLADIAAELGDLPLALHLAGSYLQRFSSITPAHYLAELRQPKLLAHPSLLGQLHRWKLSRAQSPTHHEQHVARTFALSYQQLDPADRYDATALLLLACTTYLAAGIPLPSALLLAAYQAQASATADPLVAEEAIQRLGELGLLERHGPARLRLHRLLAEFVRDTAGAAMLTQARAAIEQVMITWLQAPDSLPAGVVFSDMTAHLLRATEAIYNFYGAQGDHSTAAFVRALIDPYLLRWGAYSTVEQANATLRQQLAQPAAATIDPQWMLISLLHSGQAAIAQGEVAQARGYLSDAQEIADQIGDPNFRSGLLGELGNLLLEVNLVEAAAHNFATARQLANQASNQLLEARWCARLGHCAYQQARLAEAQSWLHQALALAQAAPERVYAAEVIGACQGSLGLCAYALGDLPAAIGYFEVGLAAARQGANRASEAIYLGNLGNCYSGLADSERANQHLAAALEIARSIGARKVVGALLHNLAELRIDQGLFDAALDAITAGAAIAEASRDPRLASDHAMALARAQLLRGAYPQAQAAAAAAVRQAALLQAPTALVLAGIAHWCAAEHSSAIANFSTAVASAQALLAHTSQLYSVLDALGLAQHGLALAGQGTTQLAKAAFSAARAACPHPGVATRSAQLVALLNTNHQT